MRSIFALVSLFLQGRRDERRLFEKATQQGHFAQKGLWRKKRRLNGCCVQRGRKEAFLMERSCSACPQCSKKNSQNQSFLSCASLQYIEKFWPKKISLLETSFAPIKLEQWPHFGGLTFKSLVIALSFEITTPKFSLLEFQACNLASA